MTPQVLTPKQRASSQQSGRIEREDVRTRSSEADAQRKSAETAVAASWLNLDWPSVIWIGGMHLAALAAPFYFTWSGLAICAVLCWITGGLGVCLGYHRLLTHASFTTWPAVRFFYAFLGGISGEGSAMVWVANHRKHHAFSDQDGDPHSPRDGGLWSHLLWLFPAHSNAEVEARVKRWSPELGSDRGIRFLHQTFLLWHFVIGGALLASGWSLYGRDVGISWLVWGLAVRMLYVFHVTWFVNSATHIWGYRNYETSDNSRNLWWVGLLAFGEGWHNNHHAYQRMAKHGHRWWEVDVTYWAIVAMEKMGLAWNVVHTPHVRSEVRSASLAGHMQQSD
ncbi:MAG: acyl-CoA desaturase [Planctomycetota bacterium]|nr:MAG: acyl-CoA desaturase [Planctomycetota bacterium]